MAPLPKERMQPSPPFSAIGVDFFGPFTIKGEVQKRVRGKCFGVIFVCLCSRAVYADTSQDYSTDSFMKVLRRFASIRGWPKTIHSDNGSQLVSASKELQLAVKDLDWISLQRFGIKSNTTWKFSPADSPWYNGATEVLVKTIKKALQISVGEQILKYSELQTVMFEASQLVNQRPIGTHPSNPEDGPYLCPNDLMLGRSSPNAPQGPFMERASLKYRFDFIQKVVESFWRRWSRDVFPSLVIRQKWHTQKRNVQKGDVVLIEDSNTLRGEWKRGIVTNTIPSIDGRVRRVTVSYKNFNPSEHVKDYKGVNYTNVERPVQQLIVLVTNDERSCKQLQ